MHLSGVEMITKLVGLGSRSGKHPNKRMQLKVRWTERGLETEIGTLLIPEPVKQAHIVALIRIPNILG